MATVIRHRPFGGGDPYHLEPDQRVPPVPVDGEPLLLGALASPDITAVMLEWVVDGRTSRIPATNVGLVARDGSWIPAPVGPPTAGAGPWSPPDTSTPSGGHLASAARRTRRRGTVWQTNPPPIRYGEVVRYRFVADPDADQPTRWHEATAARWRPAMAVVPIGCSRIVDGSVSVLADAGRVHRIRFALTLPPGAHVTGFGERFDRVDQRGYELDSVVFEQYKNQAETGRTYFPMPFAHVVGGADRSWGFHVRTGRRVWFDVGRTDPTRLWIEVEAGGEPSVEIAFYDGAPADVLAAFLDETGHPEPLPSWVHRLWISGNEWNTQAAVMTRADRHEAEDIPYGVIVIEAWSDESTFCAFRDATYDIHLDGSPLTGADIHYPADGAWPDPAGMVDDLHARDVKLLLWQIPLQKMQPPPRGQAAADAARMIRDGYGIRAADGRPYRNRGWWFPQALMPDFTNPEARAWWLSKRRYLVDEIGVDGFKTDGGEHAWGHDLRYADGTDGSASNNRYPVEYARAYHDLLREAGKPPVTFSRAGYTGAQSYGCHWAGDENSTWAALRSSIVAGITAGLCGVTYWGWDLAGFSGDVPDPELYLRATQAACFMPIMQYHSEFNFHRAPSRDRTPWNIAERFGQPSVLTEFRRWAKLREKLVPYLHEQTIAGIRDGLPLMRAMALEVPDDPHIWAYPLQFFAGRDVLVAPVVEPGVQAVDVYLPAGDWIDLVSGASRPSGSFTRPTQLSEVPVYIRSSAWPKFADAHALLT